MLVMSKCNLMAGSLAAGEDGSQENTDLIEIEEKTFLLDV